MFDKTKVTESMFGLVGIQNPANPDYAFIDEANEESRSGRYATDNPFVKVEFIKDTMDYISDDDEELNNHLTRIQTASIAEVLDSILDKPDYIDRQVLYQNANNKTEVETLPIGFVGYEICPELEPNQAFEITRCLLEFQGTGSITLLLYNTSQKQPIKTKTVAITSTFQVVELNWRGDNASGFYKGDYYFGYRTNGITVQPIARKYEDANVMSCIYGLEFEPVQAVYTPVIANDIFDLTIEEYTSQCYGLNLDVCVFNDYTDLMIQNQMIFAPAICLQYQINLIQSFIATLRTNRNQSISEDQINMTIAQLNGVPDRIVGTIPTLRKTIEQLRKQVRRLQQGYFAEGFILNSRS